MPEGICLFIDLSIVALMDEPDLQKTFGEDFCVYGLAPGAYAKANFCDNGRHDERAVAVLLPS